MKESLRLLTAVLAISLCGCRADTGVVGSMPKLVTFDDGTYNLKGGTGGAIGKMWTSSGTLAGFRPPAWEGSAEVVALPKSGDHKAPIEPDDWPGGEVHHEYIDPAVIPAGDTACGQLLAVCASLKAALGGNPDDLECIYAKAEPARRCESLSSTDQPIYVGGVHKIRRVTNFGQASESWADRGYHLASDQTETRRAQQLFHLPGSNKPPLGQGCRSGCRTVLKRDELGSGESAFPTESFSCNVFSGRRPSRFFGHANGRHGPGRGSFVRFDSSEECSDVFP